MAIATGYAVQMHSTDLKSRLDFAVESAHAAGALTRNYFQTDISVERKADTSPVTIADREAEALLRRAIAAAFPADAILGEEMGESSGTSGYRWILDPIDGTKSFVSGVPIYATLIGLEHAGDSVLGVIHIPALNETAYAAKGHGAWHLSSGNTPVEARVSRKPRLSEGLFLTSEVKTFEECSCLEVYNRLQSAAWLTRTWGDGYGYLLVATGRAELMVDPQMHLWDCAALKPVIEEAGGTFTNWNGQPTIHGGNSIATNGLVFAETMATGFPG
jgi:histidinol phosphatase-like enzyme (inositol monophosphatase family)